MRRAKARAADRAEKREGERRPDKMKGSSARIGREKRTRIRSEEVRKEEESDS